MSELHEEVAAGERARLVLENEIYVSAYDALRQEILQRWQNSGADDAKARETLYLSLKMLDRIQSHMQSLMETGKMAQMTLAERAAQVVGLRGRTVL